MNLTIVAPKIGLTPSLEKHVREKMQKLDAHFPVIKAQVRLEKDVHEMVASVNLSVKGTELHVEKRHTDMHVAIDNVLSSALESLKRRKDKTMTHRVM